MKVPEVDAGAITTQKAKGLAALKSEIQVSDQYLNLGAVLPLLGVLKASEELPAWAKNIVTVKKVFARPCPPSPEHGFVESRIVVNEGELEKLREETLKANEASEIMLTTAIKADLNAIWTPTLLTFGPGHDGATSGKGAVSIPLSGINPLSKRLLDAAMIGDECPYIEAVLGTETEGYAKYWYLTQLRRGPVLDAGIDLDFIPQEITVGEVIKTNGEDLLAWAKVVKEIAKKPGVVVYHPGGALVDHYSVHCRVSNVPILITREPKVGEVLAPTAKIDTFDPHAMIEGLATVDRMNPYRNGAAFTILSLIALHNSSALRGSHSFWIGAGIAALLKLGVAALEAEARHAHNCYGGLKAKPDIYNWYSSRPLSFLRARLSRVTQLLHYGWGADGENGKTGFGGVRWALCGASMVPLFNGIKALIKEPSPENAGKLVLALNIAVNQAHNGGWWLNKFCDVTAYDQVPKGSLRYMLQVGPALMATSSAREAGIAHIPKFVKQVEGWPETSIKPLRWRKVDLSIEPGSFVLNLKASTLPNPRRIVIPATQTFLKSILSAAKGAIEIGNSTIDFVTPTGERLNVWNEAPLAMVARDINRR